MNVNINNWPIWAKAISAPANPDEYSEAAVDRLMKKLEKYVVRVRGVRPQFNAVNKILRIFFETPEEAQYYADTEKRYIEKKIKLQERLGIIGGEGMGIWELVLLNERCRAAEYCRRYHIARMMHEAVLSGKFAAVAAVKYKQTLIAVVRILVEEYKVSRDSISLVWGGGPTKATEKQKAKAEVEKNRAIMEAAGVDVDAMLKTLDIEDEAIVEEVNLPASLRLGSQSRDERQREIDKFQSGKSLYCLYTFKAGGVGLSLHHTDELTNQWNVNAPGYAEWRAEIDAWNKHRKPEKQVKPGKVRHKESGYAFEEDIPFIPVRPRKNFVAPTYSGIELVQGLGRCPRLTSLSETEQFLLFYGGTVEDGVSRIVSAKLRCLSRVVRMREDWQDVCVGGCSVDEHVENTKDMVDDPDELTTEEEEEE